MFNFFNENKKGEKLKFEMYFSNSNFVCINKIERILLYTNEKITLCVDRSNLCIVGELLTIKKIEGRLIEIKGNIKSIEVVQ